ncbi:sulfate transporter [Pandoraea apista]|uniref:Sulfate transporter n=2 Tax=Pandoraea apista TaxID=93218 RepID=A0A5E5P6F7_9BURK|nr:sulfate transporter [Pandoraea apista]
MMTEHTSETIPAGYRKNALGHLVPEATIRDIDLERDSIVRELIDAAKDAQENLRGLKERVFGDANAFISLSADKYGVKLGGAKGNVTLHSFDGSLKVVIQRAENMSFDERLQAAKVLIDECITDWARGSDPKIQVLVQQAFETDKEGKINVGRVLALRRLEIDDEKWQRAMQAIGESVQVVGTKTYMRFYERVDGSEQYTPISLDFASL